MLCSLLLLAQQAAEFPAESRRQSYRAHLAAAHALIELGRPARAAEWLGAAPAEERGWEWRHLLALTDRSLRTIPAGAAGVVSVEIAPDGARAATAHGDGRIRLWRLPEWTIEAEVLGHEDGAYTARFSPDGSKLLTASRDRTARIWSVPELAELRVFRGHGQALGGASWHPDGVRIVSCSWRRDPETNVAGQVLLWSLDEAVEPRELVSGIKPLSDVRFDPTGGRCATISWNGDLHLFDLSGAEPVQSMIPLPDYGIYRAADALAWSPDGARLAVACRDGSISVFRAAGGAPLAAIPGSGEGLRALAWSPDGNRLASGGQDMLVRIWSSDQLALLDSLPGHSRNVRGLSWTATEGLISAAADGSLRSWPVDGGGGQRLDFAPNPDGIWETAWTPDERSMFGASFDGSVVEWDPERGVELRRWLAHPENGCHGVSLSADGARLLSTAWDGTARLWDTRDGTPLGVFRVEGGGCYDSDLSPDGALAAATHGGKLSIWSVPAGELLHLLEAGTRANGVCFDAAGARLGVAGGDGKARVFDARTGAELKVFDAGEALSDVTFSPDGSWLASCGSGGAVHRFDLRGDAPPLVLWRADESLMNLAWSPDGARLAVTSEFLTLLDAQHGGVLLQVHPHRDSAWRPLWSADGSRLVSCSSDGSVVVFSAPAPAAR